MRLLTRRLPLAVVVAALWCSVGAFFAPVQAAPIPLPPIPTPPIPAPVVPVLELLAPVASPQCGNALFAAVLLRTETGAVPGGLPLDPIPILGPAFVVCGTVGVAPNRLTCSPDAVTKGILDEITGTAAGLSTPADTRVAGPAVEELYLLQDNLPAPANTAGLADTASGTLTCTPVAAAKAPPSAGSPEPAPSPAPDSEPAFDTFFDSGVLGDFASGLPATSLAAPPSPAPAQVRGSAPVRTALVRSGGYAYPVIFLLPLLALAIGGYLARGLTRPVTARAREEG